MEVLPRADAPQREIDSEVAWWLRGVVSPSLSDGSITRVHDTSTAPPCSFWTRLIAHPLSCRCPRFGLSQRLHEQPVPTHSWRAARSRVRLLLFEFAALASPPVVANGAHPAPATRGSSGLRLLPANSLTSCLDLPVPAGAQLIASLLLTAATEVSRFRHTSFQRGIPRRPWVEPRRRNCVIACVCFDSSKGDGGPVR